MTELCFMLALKKEEKNLWIKPLPEFCNVYPHGLSHGQGESELSNVQINVLMD